MLTASDMGQGVAATRMVVGVDVGLEGGVAVVDGQSSPRLFPMPTLEVMKGGKLRRQYDDMALVNLFTDILASMPGVCAHRSSTGGHEPHPGEDCLIVHATPLFVMERVQAMPEQGSTSGFNFGFGAGTLNGIIKCLRMPLERVEPRTWKKYFGLIGAGKDASIAMALQQVPSLSTDQVWIAVRKSQRTGLADAVLIAEWARRTR